MPARSRQGVVIPRSGGVPSALPAHDSVIPDRGERRSATLRDGMVSRDPERVANGDGPLSECGEVDADFRKRAMHRQ
jgi:hypothetical protein